MSTYKDVLQNGGKLLVVGGRDDSFWPDEVRNHPQVVVFTGDEEGYKEIPSGVQAVVFSRAIKHETFKMVHKQARARKLLVVPGFRSQGDVKRTLQSLVNHEPVEMKVASLADEEVADGQLTEIEKQEKPTAARGAVQQFVIDHADLRQPTTNEARRLFDIAQTRGLKTTVGSLAQAIVMRRRKLNLGDIPRSATPRMKEPAFRTAMRDVDNAIAAFQLLREHIEQLAKENEELKSWKGLVMKKFKDIFGSDLNM